MLIIFYYFPLQMFNHCRIATHYRIILRIFCDDSSGSHYHIFTYRISPQNRPPQPQSSSFVSNESVCKWESDGRTSNSCWICSGLAATNTSSSTVIPPTTMKRELFIITTFLSILILLLRTMVIGSCFLRYYNKQFVYQPVILSRRKERVKSDSLF